MSASLRKRIGLIEAKLKALTEKEDLSASAPSDAELVSLQATITQLCTTQHTCWAQYVLHWEFCSIFCEMQKTNPALPEPKPKPMLPEPKGKPEPRYEVKITGLTNDPTIEREHSRYQITNQSLNEF